MSRKLPKSREVLTIGLTGGIGAGKSVVAKVFQALAIPIFNSDLEARTIIEEDELVKSQIKTLLGPDSYKNEKPDRPYIASKIFANSELREALNQIVHPAVGRSFGKWLTTNSSASYLIKEAAILFETDIYKSLDKNIIVTAPQDVRIDRIQKRDGLSREKIEERMNAQWPEEKKRALADFEIINDGSNALIPQILEIHKKLQGI